MCMVRFVLVAILVASPVLVGSQPQKQDLMAGMKGPVSQMGLMPGGRRCGEFFQYFPSTTKMGELSLTFTFATPGENGVTYLNIIHRFDLERFRVVENPALLVPTVTILRTDGPLPHLEIALSPEELKRSKCLIKGLAA